MIRISESNQSTHWYVLNLGAVDVDELNAGAYLWLTHPNCGRIKNTKPRRKPDKNPPIWAKLSTCGRIPTARLTTIIITSVVKAAT